MSGTVLAAKVAEEESSYRSGHEAEATVAVASYCKLAAPSVCS